MFLYIIRTPILELKSAGEKCGLYTVKDGSCFALTGIVRIRLICYGGAGSSFECRGCTGINIGEIFL